MSASVFVPAALGLVGSMIQVRREQRAQRQQNQYVQSQDALAAQYRADDIARQDHQAAIQRQDTIAANQQAQGNFERMLTSSVQERVADARKAGISPLAALGMPGASPPHLQVASRAGGSIGSGLSGLQQQFSAGTGMGAHMREMADKYMEYNERRLDRKLRRERLIDRFERAQLKASGLNDRRKFEAKLARMQHARYIGGLIRRSLARAKMNQVERSPAHRTAIAQHEAQGTYANPIPMAVWYHDPATGRKFRAMSENAAEAMEGGLPGAYATGGFLYGAGKELEMIKE
jgi:hypothetical protein